MTSMETQWQTVTLIDDWKLRMALFRRRSLKRYALAAAMIALASLLSNEPFFGLNVFEAFIAFFLAFSFIGFGAVAAAYFWAKKQWKDVTASVAVSYEGLRMQRPDGAEKVIYWKDMHQLVLTKDTAFLPAGDLMAWARGNSWIGRRSYIGLPRSIFEQFDDARSAAETVEIKLL